MSGEVEVIAKQIVEAAQITLSPTASYNDRVSAYQFLEKTKDNVKLAIPCGFLLSRNQNESQIRHLGLQFLEDTIRYHWNDLTLAEKIYIKENSMLLLSNGTHDVLIEAKYVKDKVSRLIVEMIKREWPQRWPNLLEELELLANSNPTSAELVLLIFMRISEDVATLQNLESSQRRKDLLHSLNQGMNTIFLFFLSLLEVHHTKYVTGTSDEKTRHCKVTEVIISTMTCYTEWIPVCIIKTHQFKLFIALCLLITDKNLRQSAAECFLQILSRKGRSEERKFIISLFSVNVMECICTAATLAVSDPLNEDNYLFLKTLTQVVTSLGSQLCSLWGKEQDVAEPPCFPIYLDTLLNFTKHPSLTIYYYTATLWNQFFRNEWIRKNKTFSFIVSLWLPIAYCKVVKHGFPSESPDLSSQYSSLDFDSDEEYHLFFSRVRCETLSGMRLASIEYPEILFNFLKSQFEHCFSFHTGELNSRDASPEKLKALKNSWEALSHVIERILPQIKHSHSIPVSDIRIFLNVCLSIKSHDPDVISLILSCVSGICCVMLPSLIDVLESVLSNLFECTKFHLDSPPDNFIKPIINLRNHAASLLLKLSKTFPSIFLAYWDKIDSNVRALIDDDEVSYREKTILFQSLIVLNAHRTDYETQSNYIGELILNVKNDWLNMKGVFYSSGSLISFVGLDTPPNEKGEGEAVFVNRSKLRNCIEHITALLSRCKVELDDDATKRGGFVISHLTEGCVLRNPAAPHFFTLLPLVFCCLRAYNGLYLAESLSLLHPAYANVHSMPEDEKKSLLGLTSSSSEDHSEKSDLQKVQFLLRCTKEFLCSALSMCGPILGLEFYQYPQLAECLIHSIFWNLKLLPNLDLRFVVRMLKSLIDSCPTACIESVIAPVVSHVLPLMSDELHLRWERVAALPEDSEYDEDKVSQDELVDTILLHAMTRDYMDALVSLLIDKSKRQGKMGKVKSNGSFDCDMEMGEVEEPVSMPQCQEVLSVLGKTMLKSSPIWQSVVSTLFRALAWPDSVSSRKAVEPSILCVREALTERQHLHDGYVREMFLMMLKAIHVHGPHKDEIELLLDGAILLYELLIPHFPILKKILLDLPGVDSYTVNNFENFIKVGPDAATRKGSKQNKFKREAFQKVVHNVIGKSMGEAFKKEVQFTALNPIVKIDHSRRATNDESHVDINLCSLFGTE